MKQAEYWEYMSGIWNQEEIVQNFINFMPETKVKEQYASVLGYDRYWLYHIGIDNVY